MRTLPLTLVLVALAGQVPAENMINIGYGEGAPGDSDVPVIITASNDTAIHGYSLALTYPSEALALTSFTTVGTQVQATVTPDFIASNVSTPGVGILGVIFSFNDNGNGLQLKEFPASTAGSYPRVIARLSFNVKGNAPGGIHALRLRDGIGTPANFNRFTSRGTSIAPRLVDGSFLVTGGNALVLEKKLAIAGATPSLPIFAYAQHPDPLTGFQIAFTYEKAALTLPDLVAAEQGHQNASYNGTTLGFLLGANKIEFFSAEDDREYSPTLARSTCAALFDYVQPFDGQTLEPDTSATPTQSLIKWVFRVEAPADDQRQWQDLTLDNSGVPGLVDNRFIVEDRGVDPRLVHGKIYFSLGNLVGRIVNSDTKAGVAGAKVVTDPDGYEATTDNGGNFRLAGIPPGNYTLLVSKTTAPPSFYKIRHFKTEANTDIVVEGLDKDTAVGTLPIYPISVGTSGQKKPFLRGHVNEDDKIDLSDAVTLLLFLFRGGSPPSCAMASDTNDDNKADISDAVFLLNYLFAGGLKPPAPFLPGSSSDGCTADPTPGGELTCEVSSCGG